MDYPESTVDIVKEMVRDGVEKFPQINRVGLIGSFSRGNPTVTSDVDLILDIEEIEFQNMLETFGRFVSHTLDYQFNKRLDIIRYGLAVERANNTPKSEMFWYHQEGYRQMLKEVRWIYERQNYSAKDKILS